MNVGQNVMESDWESGAFGDSSEALEADSTPQTALTPGERSVVQRSHSSARVELAICRDGRR